MGGCASVTCECCPISHKHLQVLRPVGVEGLELKPHGYQGIAAHNYMHICITYAQIHTCYTTHTCHITHTHKCIAVFCHLTWFCSTVLPGTVARSIYKHYFLGRHPHGPSSFQAFLSSDQYMTSSSVLMFKDTLLICPVSSFTLNSMASSSITTA